MNNNDMVERYIYAVVKSLPAKTRDDVARELRSIITDMLDERGGGTLPTEHDVRVVLTELGMPSQMREKYNPAAKSCLIGGAHYVQYKMVLKIVLICAAFGLSMAAILTGMTERNALSAFGQWIGTIWTGLMNAFGAVTLLYAFLYQRDIRIDADLGSLDDLPPVPVNEHTLSKWESVAEIVLSVLFATAFLAFSDMFAVILRENGDWIPLFAADAIYGSRFIVAGLGIVGVLRGCVKLLEGRYTLRLMAAALACNLVSTALCFWWLLGYKLLNPEIPTLVMELIGSPPEILGALLTNLQSVVLGVLALLTVADTVSVVVKTLRHSVSNAAEK